MSISSSPSPSPPSPLALRGLSSFPSLPAPSPAAPGSVRAPSLLACRTDRFASLRAFSSPQDRQETPSPAASPSILPVVDLEFLGPEKGSDGVANVNKVSVGSGEKLLRTVMNEEKLELYNLYGKVMNCGGGGSCGTCIVEIVEGSELLNERTDAEYRHLKKKPENWRLACQTIVGNKSNSGKVVVQRLPQKKK